MRVEFRDDHVMIQGDETRPSTRVKLADLPELLVKLNFAAKNLASRLVAESHAAATLANELLDVIEAD